MESREYKVKESFEKEYGFYGRLKEEFPSQIIVDVTEVCNLACTHCAHRTFEKSEYYSGSFLSPELNAKLVDDVRTHGKGFTQYIRYTGEGEPLIHRYIYEMLEYAVKNSGVAVTLTTNGTLLNEKRTDHLLATGVGVVDISIDAFTPETYAKIRTGSSLNVTRTNVLKLLEMAKKPPYKTKVVVSYIEQPLNLRETADFEKFWKDSGADYVIVRRLHSSSGALPVIANQMREESAQEVRRPCLYPWERIVLNPRGYLSFCPADWTHESTIIDYRITSIHDIWSGEFYQSIRKAHLVNDYSKHKFCGQCPDWKSTRWPDEGRSYADMIKEFKERE